MLQNSRSPLFLRGRPGSRKIHGPRYFCGGDPEVAKFTVPIIFAGVTGKYQFLMRPIDVEVAHRLITQIQWHA